MPKKSKISKIPPEKSGPKKKPWNKGKAVGQKKPFTRQQVRFLREVLEEKNRRRDLALLNVALDTMLRASDLLKLTVEDLVNRDNTIKKEFQIRQKKTQAGLLVSIKPETQKIIERWIKESKKIEEDFLFTGLKGKSKYDPLTIRQYSRLIKQWAEWIQLDSKDYSTHSLRRSKAAYIYKKTLNPELVRQLLGQKSVTATSHYLNISHREALEIAQETEF
jgi:integrase